MESSSAMSNLQVNHPAAMSRACVHLMMNRQRCAPPFAFILMLYIYFLQHCRIDRSRSTSRHGSASSSFEIHFIA